MPTARGGPGRARSPCRRLLGVVPGRFFALEARVAVGLLVGDVVKLAGPEGEHHAEDENEQQRRHGQPDDDRRQRHRLAQRIARLPAERVDRRAAAGQARGDERQGRRLRDDDEAQDDAHEVAVGDEVRAGAEQHRGGQGESEVHEGGSPTRRARWCTSVTSAPVTRRKTPRSNGTAVMSSSVPTWMTWAPGAGAWVSGGSPSATPKKPLASAVRSPATATAGARFRTGSPPPPAPTRGVPWRGATAGATITPALSPPPTSVSPLTMTAAATISAGPSSRGATRSATPLTRPARVAGAPPRRPWRPPAR